MGALWNHRLLFWDYRAPSLIFFPPVWLKIRFLLKSLRNFDLLGSTCWTRFPHSARINLQKIVNQCPWDLANLQNQAPVYTVAQFSLLAPAHSKDYKQRNSGPAFAPLRNDWATAGGLNVSKGKSKRELCFCTRSGKACPAMGGTTYTNAPGIAPWLYIDIYIYIYPIFMRN